MKKLLATALFLASTTAAMAEPALMLGVSYNFGGAMGVTLKVLSTNRQDEAALAVGLSYAPGRGDNRWSWDTGLAYNFKRSSLVLSYDWLPSETQLSVGLSNLTAAQAAVEPAPAVAAPTPEFQ